MACQSSIQNKVDRLHFKAILIFTGGYEMAKLSIFSLLPVLHHIEMYALKNMFMDIYNHKKWLQHPLEEFSNHPLPLLTPVYQLL